MILLIQNDPAVRSRLELYLSQPLLIERAGAARSSQIEGQRAVPTRRPVVAIAAQHHELRDALLAGLRQSADESQRSPIVIFGITPSLADLAWWRSAVPTAHFLGLGTSVLSKRLRQGIAARLRVAPRDISAWVVGGVGDQAVPLWSSATVGGVPLHLWAVPGHGRMTVRDRIDIFLAAQNGATADLSADAQDQFEAWTDLVEAIQSDANRVLPVSSSVTGYRGIADAWLSLPCIVNARGAEPPLEVPMNDAELAGLHHAAELSRAAAGA